jgi:hypothetical protein
MRFTFASLCKSFSLHNVLRTQEETSALSAPPEIVELAQKFDRRLNEYRSSCYNEEELRTEFVNPFFEATDRQINALVYELYGLTEEEIRIVEEACK